MAEPTMNAQGPLPARVSQPKPDQPFHVAAGDAHGLGPTIFLVMIHG